MEERNRDSIVREVLTNGINNRNFYYPVFMGMATIYERRDVLRGVIEKVLPQIDHLYVYLNYDQGDEVPDYLNHPRITYLHAQDSEDGRIGDRGKFYFLEEIKRKYQHGYYFSVDDDIWYPEDYVIKTIKKIDEYDRRCAISYHGGILPSKTIQCYCKERNLIAFQTKVNFDIFINNCGTGVTAFCLDHIGLSYEDFQEPNCADIWFSMYCQKNQVPIVCVEKPSGWILAAEVPEEIVSNTLWDMEISSANHQVRNTKYANQIKWVMHRSVKDMGNGISVIMPTYNTPVEYLGEAIKSVISQNFIYHIELIIIDDGSDEEYAKHIPTRCDRDNVTIKVIRLANNQGLPTALNTGIANCSHDLVARMDADDIMLPTRLMIQYMVMKKFPEVHILGTDVVIFKTENGNKIVIRRTSHPTVVDRDLVVQTGMNWFINHPTVMYRKETVLRVGGYDTKLRGYPEDVHLWMKLMQEGYRIYNLKNPLLMYRATTNQLSNNFNGDWQEKTKAWMRDFLVN